MRSEESKEIMDKYTELQDLANQFADCNVRIESEPPYNLMAHENMSCHCHPEYQWVFKHSFDEFGKWLDKREKGNN